MKHRTRRFSWFASVLILAPWVAAPAVADPLVLDNTWTPLTPAVVIPATQGSVNLAGSGYWNRPWSNAAYDAKLGRTLLWEGLAQSPGRYPYTIYSNSIWALDAATETLSLVRVNHWYNGPGSGYDTLAYAENATEPTPADRHPTFTYVSDTNSLYAFGGLNMNIGGGPADHPSDTWKLDLSTKRWTEITPAVHPKGDDSATWPTLVYDPSQQRIVLHSTRPGAYEGTRRTWLFDVLTETYEEVTSAPQPEFAWKGGNAMAYDSTRQRVWLFGAGAESDELWRFDTAARRWTQIVATGAKPTGRVYHGFVYIPRHDVFLLYGGSDDGALRDVWVFAPQTASWTRLADGPHDDSGFVDMTYDEANDLVMAQRGSESGWQWWAFRYVPADILPDTRAPTVVITAPQEGATYSGSVALAASASDDVAVAGVSFFVDGTRVGIEDVVPPYGAALDTQGLGAGAHVLTAVARDTSNNATTSAPITFIVSGPVSRTCGAGVTQADLVVEEPTLPRPPLLAPYADPGLGGCVQRVTDGELLGAPDGGAVHTYSQLQAWNADQTKLLLASGQILDATTYELYRDLAVPQAVRWSPTDPNHLIGLDGRKLVRQDIRTGVRTTIREFPEYARFDKDPSWEEMSLDGRLIGLIGVTSSGAEEAFWYDLEADVKGPVLSAQPPGLPCGTPDWVAPSPSGKYFIVSWGGGGSARYCSTEAFDLQMNYLGKVATGHGHGDLAIDEHGDEWLVYFTGDDYAGIGGPRVVKARIPDGWEQWHDAGGVDGTGMRSLLNTGWYAGSGHISCQAPHLGWCVVSTYDAEESERSTWAPLEQEVYRVYLDSTEASPHLERLAHHRTAVDYIRPLPSESCPVSSYWAQPHASANRDGTRIIFGSSWGRACRADAYVIDLGPPPACLPTSCAAQSATCGSIPDGCGGVLNCGVCQQPDPDPDPQPVPQPEPCPAGSAEDCEAPSQCVPGSAGCGAACALATCGEANALCGVVPDGCGGELDCGACPGTPSVDGGMGCSASSSPLLWLFALLLAGPLTALRRAERRRTRS